MSPKISYLAASDLAQGKAKVDIFDQAVSYGLEELHIKCDNASGLKVIVAIHNTNRGPALGGSRCLPYPSTDHALYDAIRLARGMSYKSAFAELPFGGGKAVLIRPESIQDREVYFETYGDFINNLSGRFYTAVDVGTSVADMDIVARKTKYAWSTSDRDGDPSLYTATGVLNAILAAAKARLNRDGLEGLHVAIQGVGKVGFHLVRLLSEHGTIVKVSDINDEAAQRCADTFPVIVVENDRIFETECDVFSPCALGLIINDATIRGIKAPIICGAANNQLVSDRHGDMLHRAKIFYVPDYVANAGGLIHVIFGDSAKAREKTAAIYDSVSDLYHRAEMTQEPSHRVANRMAEENLVEMESDN